MKTSFQLHRKVILIFLCVLCCSLFGYFFLDNFEIKKKEDAVSEPLVFSELRENSEGVSYEIFDPNDYKIEDWQKIGFTEKQAQTILKYKKLLGGQFSSLEEISKCYVIPPEKFSAMAPFIRIKTHISSQRHFSDYKRDFRHDGLSINHPFDPDLYSVEDWVNIGFTEKQAVSILRYKHFLGGHFGSAENISKCYVIGPKQFEQMRPFLRMTPKTSTYQKEETKYVEEKPKTKIDYFDPNALDEAGWQQLGFTEKQTQTILNYKNKYLKGQFTEVSQLAQCYAISSEKYEWMKDFVVINKNKSVETKTAKENTTPTDFAKVDLNSVSYHQLLEFGFDEISARSFMGFRKKLGGFISKEQILKTYNIDQDKALELIKIAHLDADSVKKYSLINAPESWLQNHPYFKYYADKIIFLRITYPDEQQIFKKLKLKPEIEKQMKSYLL